MYSPPSALSRYPSWAAPAETTSMASSGCGTSGTNASRQVLRDSGALCPVLCCAGAARFTVRAPSWGRRLGGAGGVRQVRGGSAVIVFPPQPPHDASRGAQCDPASGGVSFPATVRMIHPNHGEGGHDDQAGIAGLSVGPSSAHLGPGHGGGPLASRRIRKSPRGELTGLDPAAFNVTAAAA